MDIEKEILRIERDLKEVKEIVGKMVFLFHQHDQVSSQTRDTVVKIESGAVYSDTEISKEMILSFIKERQTVRPSNIVSYLSELGYAGGDKSKLHKRVWFHLEKLRTQGKITKTEDGTYGA